jgi:hypothetical protein
MRFKFIAVLQDGLFARRKVSSITVQYVIFNNDRVASYMYAAAPTVCGHHAWIIFLVLQESRQLPCNASLPIVLSQVLATARLARLQ